MLDFTKLSADYLQTLLRQVAPFWLTKSCDERCGGYFDYLSATGEVINGDKFVLSQAQQSWAFAWLYNHLDAQPAYLNHALHGGTFLSQFAHDDALHCYAQLDRRGRSLSPTSDIVADCYAVMAYAELHYATGEDEWALLAKQTFTKLLERRAHVRNNQVQSLGGFQQLRHLSEPVALLKTTLSIQPLLDEDSIKEAVDAAQHELLTEFLDRRTDTLREFILPEGAFIDTPEGRRQQVGLTFRVISALLDLCGNTAIATTGTSRATNRKLAGQVTAWGVRLCEQAWDETAGGLLQYVDQKGQPLIYADWQHKWGWVQVEALAALIKAYYQLHHTDCLKWFRRIHDYTFQHFPDPKHTGWQLVLDQTNQPLLSAKAMPAAESYVCVQLLAETSQILVKCSKQTTRERSHRVF